MSLFDAYAYRGKRALIVGGATGMGAAVAAVVKDAGAEVIVMDRAEVELDGVTSIHVDMSDRDSIDAAVEKCGGPVHAHFACAGVADGTPGIERINFIGHRHMIDKMIDAGHIGRGAAIGFISSAAGLGWEANLTILHEFLAIPDFDGAVTWVEKNAKADYMFSKLAINAYVARQAFPLLKQGIRINAILPGPTDTPLAQANAEMWLGFGSDYRGEAGIEASTALEQAYPLVFLCSDAASGITGITMVTDSGYVSSGVTESFPSASPVVGFLRGSMYG
jgi:NAD(P)-dependent dehydrogenase (short-subunit alcohol dehydrogenase family)